MQSGKVKTVSYNDLLSKKRQLIPIQKKITAASTKSMLKEIPSRSCISDGDCATLTPNGEFECKDNICVLPCDPIIVPDECETKLGQPYYQCDPSVKHCLMLSESEELSFNNIIEGWKERDQEKYFKNMAWFITQFLGASDFLAPIRCDFSDSLLQVVSEIPVLRTGHTICKYSWFTNSEYRNKDASCQQTSVQYLANKCTEKCDSFSEGSQKFKYYHSGCDGFAPWCLCQKTHTCNYDVDCNDLKAENGDYHCVKPPNQTGYCSL